MGHLLKLKYALGTLEYARILASTSVPFIPTMDQMPNLALIKTKRITMNEEIHFVTFILLYVVIHNRNVVKCDILHLLTKYHKYFSSRQVSIFLKECAKDW